MAGEAATVLAPLLPSACNWLRGCLRNLLLDHESPSDELDAKLQKLAGQWYEIAWKDFEKTKSLDVDIDEGYKLVYEADKAASLQVHRPVRCLPIPRDWYQNAQLATKILKLTSELKQKWNDPSTSAGIGTSEDQISDHRNENEDWGGRIGMDEELSEVEGLLTAEGGQHWVGAHGMPGAGKTLLAMTIFKERPAIKKHFDMVFFITFGQGVQQQKVRNDLMEQVKQQKKPVLDDDFTNRVPQEIPRNRQSSADVRVAETTLRHIADELEGCKFLLIVDDVWEEMTESLKQFNLLLLRSSSAARILVTSRDGAVLKGVHASLVHMEKLSEESSKKLFDRHAGEPDVAKELVEQVVTGCEGLPLLLKVIGSFMATAAGDTASWNRRVDMLKRAKLMDEEETGKPEGKRIIRRLKLSYDALPTTKDINYKECFSYLSMLPQGEWLYVQDFSLYWEAEGLLRHASDGSKVFRKLEQQCLVEKHSELGPDVYKLHASIHALATDILEKERRGCYVQSAADTVDFKRLEELCKKSRLRRMTIDQVAQPLESKVSAAAHTSALFLRNISLVSRNFITSFLGLKVLVMIETSMTKLPEYIGLLSNLVTLDISRNQSLVEIPSRSISTLTKLAHLDIRNCKKLIDFPADALLGMSNLSFLHAEDSWRAWIRRENENSFVGLELLRRLQQLERVWIDSEFSITVPDRPSRNLVQLRIRSKVSVRLEDASSSFWSKLTGLEELCLKNLVNPDMDCGSLCSRLRICELKVVEPSASSGSLEHLTSLEKLRLTRSRSLEDFPADRFTMLKVLKLSECHSVSRIPVLPKLERLQIVSCDALEQIEVHGCHKLERIGLWFLPMLEMLSLVNAPDSRNRSQSLESLPKLTFLWICKCPELKTLIQHSHRSLEALMLPGDVLWQQLGPFSALTWLGATGNDQLGCLARVDASALPRLSGLQLEECQAPLPPLPEWLVNQIKILRVGTGCNLSEEWLWALVHENMNQVSFYEEPDWAAGRFRDWSRTVENGWTDFDRAEVPGI